MERYRFLQWEMIVFKTEGKKCVINNPCLNSRWFLFRHSLWNILCWFKEVTHRFLSIMKIKKCIYLIILTEIIFLILFLMQMRQTSLSLNQFQSTICNPVQVSNEISSCTPRKIIESEVKFYNISPNHYEYRYELNKQNTLSNESRLILLLTGQSRACID